MGDVRLSSPRLQVIRDGVLDPLVVQTANPDLVLWDRTRGKHRWAKMEDAPFLWLTFIAWAAARRTGAIDPGFTFERWETEVLDVTDMSEPADDDDDMGRPTLPGPEPG